ncbi:hypothetical protein K438DRAFT_1859044 [Mycena galopus ATCC 62051]|nr:hypothetical protein K438DRAFT_1859044 [Mycena galopus ATCC 62051]
MASYAGPALLGLLVHAYAAPFHLTLCGHRRVSYAPRIRRRRPLLRLSASPLPSARRPRHIHRPVNGQAPQQPFASADIMRYVRPSLVRSFEIEV